jgi:hypothetical protein
MSTPEPEPKKENIVNLENLIIIKSKDDPAVLEDRKPSLDEINNYLNQNNVGNFIAYRNKNTVKRPDTEDGDSNNLYNLLQIVKNSNGEIITKDSSQVVQINVISGLETSVYVYPTGGEQRNSKVFGGRSRQRKTLARKNRKSRSRKNRKSRSRKNRK